MPPLLQFIVVALAAFAGHAVIDWLGAPRGIARATGLFCALYAALVLA